MALYELDPATSDTHVGTLWYPDISVQLDCSYSGCSSSQSSDVGPTNRQGFTDLPDASIRIVVDAEHREEELVQNNLPSAVYRGTRSPKTVLVAGQPRTKGPSPSATLIGGAARSLTAGYSGSFPALAEFPPGDIEIDVRNRDTDEAVADATILYVEHNDHDIMLRAIRPDDNGRGVIRSRNFEEREVLIFADDFGRLRKTIFPTAGTTEVGAELTPSGSISGLVYSSSGELAVGAQARIVYARQSRESGEIRSRLKGDFHRGAPTTDSDGAFRFLDVQPQRLFLVSVTHGDESSTVGPFILSPRQEIENLQVVLR